VDLLNVIPLQRDHLSAYAQVDVALDTWPYAGTTTTCEALVMGVPVVTLGGGGCHAHNVGASLLACVGYPQFVARSEGDYAHIALTLAQAPDRLKVPPPPRAGFDLRRRSARSCGAGCWRRRFVMAPGEWGGGGGGLTGGGTCATWRKCTGGCCAPRDGWREAADNFELFNIFVCVIHINRVLLTKRPIEGIFVK
jgi:hypothetical protein